MIKFHCEALKYACRQTKDGIIVSFVIHPADVPKDLMLAPIGTQFVLAGQEYAEEPPEETPTLDGEAMVRSAGKLCKLVSFAQFMAKHQDKKIDGKTPEEIELRTADVLRAYLGVNSRADLARDRRAQQLFRDLTHAYDVHMGWAPP